MVMIELKTDGINAGGWGAGVEGIPEIEMGENEHLPWCARSSGSRRKVHLLLRLSLSAPLNPWGQLLQDRCPLAGI